MTTFDVVTAAGPDSAGDALLGLADMVPLLLAELFIAAFMSGIQRIKGVKSATSTMYQFLRTESHRAPRAFALSLSAKGVTKLILMASIVDTQDHLGGKSRTACVLHVFEQPLILS